MAKAQKRSNREIRKPKAEKAKSPVALAERSSSLVSDQVAAHARKPKGKL
jgi:hypothetical protein